MKKFMLLLFVMIFLFGGSAYGLTINSGSINVGCLDSIVLAGTVANSYESELAWVQTHDSTLFFEESNTYEVTSSDWTLVDNQTTQWAAELLDTPDHYFIKIGSTQSLPSVMNTHYLYDNADSFAYAVIDIIGWYTESGLPVPSSINIGKVSHLGEVGGAPVPEPATMLLLGTGLVGLAGASRKKFLKKS